MCKVRMEWVIEDHVLPVPDTSSSQKLYVLCTYHHVSRAFDLLFVHLKECYIQCVRSESHFSFIPGSKHPIPVPRFPPFPASHSPDPKSIGDRSVIIHKAT